MQADSTLRESEQMIAGEISSFMAISNDSEIAIASAVKIDARWKILYFF